MAQQVRVMLFIVLSSNAYPIFIFAKWSLCIDYPLWLKSYSKQAIFQQCEFIQFSWSLGVSSDISHILPGHLVRPRPSVKNSLHAVQINMKLRISVQKLMTRWLPFVLFRSIADWWRGSQITEIYNSLESKEALAHKLENSVSPSAKASSSPSYSTFEPKTVTRKRKIPVSENEETDEQMAKRLQGEYDGSRTRQQRSSRSARPAKKTRRKSQAHVDSEERNDDKNEDKKKKRGGAFNKELLLRRVFPYPLSCIS